MNPKTPYQKMRENRVKAEARVLRAAEKEKLDAQMKHRQQLWDMQDRIRQEKMCQIMHVPYAPIVDLVQDDGQSFSAAYFGDAGGLPR